VSHLLVDRRFIRFEELRLPPRPLVWEGDGFEIYEAR
jgi:hypothetical protein